MKKIVLGIALLLSLSALAAGVVSPPVGLQGWVSNYAGAIYLKWAAPADTDVQVYRVYRNGDVVATTFNTYFEDIEYDREELGVYWVTTVDAAGAESKPSNMIRDPRMD